MARYFIEISYKGTNYHGIASQIEGNPLTIQDELERVLQLLLKEKIETHTSSRTDAGVHALQNFLHFDTYIPLPNNLIFKCNVILKNDLQVKNIFLVAPEAHSRFLPISRSYRYHINLNKNPFYQDTAWNLSYKLDLEILKQTAQIILQYKDFTGFSKKHSQTFTNLCNVTESYWINNKDGLISFFVTSNRFLRGMVRALVATQINVALQKISLKEFESLLQNKIIASADFGAPGHGLFLERVCFPEDFEMIAQVDSFQNLV